MMASVGDCVELAFSDLARDGRGIGRSGDAVVFVAGGLPGERARVRLTRRRRNHFEGRLDTLLERSPQRRRPPCILADHCGGCSLQELSDSAQRLWKQQHIEQSLRRLGSLQGSVRPLLGSARDLGYRNRALIPLEIAADGQLRAGYYRRGSHRIVNMNRCPVLDPRLDALIAPLKGDLEASGWPVDRHGTHPDGGLRHLGLRIGTHSGETLITLIASHDRLPGLEDLARGWMDRWPAVVGVTLNLQSQASNVLLGPETRTIRGQGWLSDRFAGQTFRMASDTFFQVNSPQAERVVPALLEGLGPARGELVDAFCGIGTFSLPLAAAGWNVLGLEIQQTAVDLARTNARINGLETRCRFEQGTAAERLQPLMAGDHSGEGPPVALLLDPPRKGLDGASLEAILRSPPSTLLYLSCDPGTLARDLSALCGEGPYRMRWLQPFDFFPQTTHVEALAVLDRV